MSLTQLVLSCHNCAFEWADACAERNMHLPSGKMPCRNCNRNPEITKKADLVDNFVSVEDMLMDEALEAIQYEP